LGGSGCKNKKFYCYNKVAGRNLRALVCVCRAKTTKTKKKVNKIKKNKLLMIKNKTKKV
jgi:hypothetical protein